MRIFLSSYADGAFNMRTNRVDQGGAAAASVGVGVTGRLIFDDIVISYLNPGAPGSVGDGMQVFDLPDGYFANSSSGLIVDNFFGGDPTAGANPVPAPGNRCGKRTQRIL